MCMLVEGGKITVVEAKIQHPWNLVSGKNHNLHFNVVAIKIDYCMPKFSRTASSNVASKIRLG